MDKKPKLTVLNGKDADNQDFEEVQPEKNEIFNVEQYIDSEGKTVIALKSISDPSNITYKGSFTIPTNMGPMNVSIDFSPEMSLEECFDNFKDLAKQEIENIQKEANEANNIIVPNSRSDIVKPW